MEEKQMKEYSLGTKCVQGGYTPGNGEPRQIPIVQSTTFKYETSEAMGRLFDLLQCLLLLDRQPLFMLYSTLLPAVTILYHHLLFTEEHITFLQ